MKTDESIHLKEIIEKAIADHTITRDEYALIIKSATNDGNLDALEQALLAELQQMLQEGLVRFR
jgi:tellurite resistance protein